MLKRTALHIFLAAVVVTILYMMVHGFVHVGQQAYKPLDTNLNK